MNELAIKRKEAGFTQDQMAQILGIGISTYNQYENSQRNIPFEAAAKIAEILKVPQDQIFLPVKFTVSKLAESKPGKDGNQ